MIENEAVKVGGLLLAAGGSSRFGSPKQLAEFEGESLVRRAAKALLKAGCDPVVVVLGAEVERSAAHLTDLPVRTVINPDWESGMSSSIKTGLDSLESSTPDLAAVLITLCDQPLITGEKLKEFLKAFSETNAPVIAADYGEFSGVPALFARKKFEGLYGLRGDKGARDLIRREEDVAGISLEGLLLDVDTPADIRDL